jgi:hypothetical protein
VRVARLSLALAILPGCTAACGESASRGGATAPKSAAERARAEKGDDGDGERVSKKGKKWGGWRYQGKRDDCFFLVKRKCYVSRADACAAARCGKKQCVVEGGGPASVRCASD